MIKKILQGYMEKLHNLIPDEIREFVEYSLEYQEGTENDHFISLSINANKPKQYKIHVDDEEIKITEVSYEIKNSREINESELIKEIETTAKKYQKLCKNADIPTINPAIKKLLEVANEIRNESPEEIRWLIDIQRNGPRVELYFPTKIEEISKQELNHYFIIKFNGKNEITFQEQGRSFGKCKLPLKRKTTKKAEAKPIILKFLENLVKQIK